MQTAGWRMAAALLMATALAGAAATLPMETWELRLGGAVDFDNPQGKADGLLEAGAGYFIQDNIEVGGLAEWRYDGTDMGGGLGAFGEFNLDLDSFVMPYAGLRLIGRFGDYYQTVAGGAYLLVEPAAGLKFFLSENVALYAELVADYASRDAFVKGVIS